MAKMSWARAFAPVAVALIATTGLVVPATAASAASPAATSARTAATADELPTLTYDDVAEWAEMLVDGEDVERAADGAPFNTFGGFGSVSCNNTSNLLLDYKEEHPDVYWRILRMLFDPVEGAGLKHIKVELGADNNTSSGTEPATKRSADEPANVLRGAGFHFIADAKTINPDIEVEALRWGEPSWTKAQPDLRYQWYKETIDAAYDTYGVEFDYLSPSQNEVHANYINAELAWTVDFAKRLEADAAAEGARYDYSKIKIVALDSYRNVGQVSRAVLASPEALEQVDAIGYHYDIAGDPALTRLNKEFGMEVLYSEGVAPMIDPEYRAQADPARGGIGGTVGAVDIADRFINAYRWSGSGADPGHMTTFLFQPAVSALYEGSQYSPKHLIRASDPWSGYYEGGVGITLVRHFTQFIGEGWEYIEGASGGDGQKGDGGTVVDTSTRTALTLRTPAADVAAGDALEFSQVHANNTRTVRNFEVKVANLDTDADTPLYVWETTGPDAGDAVDADWFQNTGKVVPVRTETKDGVEYDVYRAQVQPYSILTLSTQQRGIHDSAADYESGQYAATATDDVLPLPYTDDFEYAGYEIQDVNGVPMDYVTRRGGSPRYTADQNGAFEVIGTDDGNVMHQAIHADNRGYTWNVWGDGSQRNPSTTTPSTVLGDHSWTNYTAKIDFRLDGVVRDAALDNFAGLGVRQTTTEGTGADLATYTARVHADGTWELRKLGQNVASGTVFMFDADAWHTLEVEARENVISVRLDGEQLGVYADTTTNPTMAGRISLVSGYYNTQFDDLAVTPLDGLSWHAVKVDDADARISYPQGFSFTQAGYAHFNRTQHVIAAGRSFGFDLNGTGFNLNGATGTSVLSITIDDQPARTVNVAAVGNRQTSAWFRGLEDGPHTVRVQVVSGTFSLDSVDLLVGGSTGGTTDPELRPVAVLDALPRLTAAPATVPALPETLRARSEAGGEIDAPVTWATTPAQFATPYAMVKVDGVFRDNPSLPVSTYVEVVPSGIRYFVDANAPADAPVHPAIAAAAGDTLRNASPDAAYSAAAGWGRVGSASAKGRLGLQPYDKTRETGWYSSGAATPLVYRFTLDAGEYDIATGHTEWWNPGTGRSRVVTGTVEFTAGGEQKSVAIGTHTFANGSIGTSTVLRGGFALDAATEVTVRISGAGGTEAPALSWIGIADHAETADRTALAALLAEATTAPRQAYTPETWQALRDQGVAAKAVHDDPTASQEQVDAAAAALRSALDALVEVAYLALPDYRVAVLAGEEADLPETVKLATRSGATQDVAVQWQDDAPATDQAYATVPVSGRAGQTPVTLQLEVVPSGVVYFVDAAATQGAEDAEKPGLSPAFDAVEAVRGDLVRNDIPDGVFSDDTGWGLRNPIGSGDGHVGLKARGAGSYDKTRTTGWWASAGGSVDYAFTLPAGDYELTSGYQEWWGVTRQVAPTVEIDGERIAGDPVNLSSASPQGTSTIAFSLADETVIEFRAARGSGTADPVLSWIAVADASAPAAPGEVTAEATSTTTATVSWQAPAGAGTRYDAFRVFVGDAAEPACEVAADVTSCELTGLTAGAEYDVSVQAVGFGREGERAGAALRLPEVPADDARTAPGVAVLSSDEGWDTGLKDGTFRVTMNLWWGQNGSLFKLFRDGELVGSVPLTMTSGPSAQQAVVDIAGLPNGTYRFTGELVNSRGTTATKPLTVTVTDAAPARPVLSHDNRKGSGSYTVRADLWWGTNATSYRFLENDVEVAAGELAAASPAAQSATLPVSGRAPGTYRYVVEFRNAAGVTTSAPITVTVR
ncbi:fibronectin type III domain-containing protein [Microbacterium imperiale]|uniref:galactosylceramidase n=1 Tax=Microbacterium imperiale TaxID=33884 RepID=A0A9W6M4P3_9MICO|nr:fibronectin type III domain-containing protein [Microbacterium imperiale]MBP2421823.1 hypothetical protein [Microbacterium imperiale]MDS0199076.1 fibronectin type III domain-containing protein [Microbacterium imperiale]BFE39128.1 hypothetical protein GCM10017544_00840 [Microbacterium imperiale]GLJ81119.1 hypothetical protein GCM10017586_28020 [Microbacterium imperiale]